MLIWNLFSNVVIYSEHERFCLQPLIANSQLNAIPKRE